MSEAPVKVTSLNLNADSSDDRVRANNVSNWLQHITLFKGHHERQKERDYSQNQPDDERSARVWQ